MAEQITEDGGQPNCIKNKSNKDVKRRTNREIRRLPKELGSNISKKDVTKGYHA